MAVHIVGLVVVIVFYIIIIGIGIISARKVKVTCPDDDATSTEMSMVAGRNLGLVVGIFTMAGKSNHSYPINIK